MEYSHSGLHLTEQFEGCRLIAYQDSVGVWTLGYGHTLDINEGDTCTQEQAELWLQDDIQRVVRQINKDVRWTLSQGEFDALVDFGFNLGVHALEGSTLWSYIQSGEHDKAAEEFPKWHHAGGKDVAGLLKRRLVEQETFRA